jgi:2-polyprenyl-6-hydroxyphenyl methylase/3-demethylubiquinone-9 3-methyltransferase
MCPIRPGLSGRWWGCWTLNRTPRSFLVAKLGAEYVLRLLPVGTHDWRRFLTPAEVGGLLRDAGARVTDTAGLSPGLSGWRTTRDLGVNYLLAAEV